MDKGRNRSRKSRTDNAIVQRSVVVFWPARMVRSFYNAVGRIGIIGWRVLGLSGVIGKPLTTVFVNSMRWQSTEL